VENGLRGIIRRRKTRSKNGSLQNVTIVPNSLLDLFQLRGSLQSLQLGDIRQLSTVMILASLELILHHLIHFEYSLAHGCQQPEQLIFRLSVERTAE